MVRERFFYFPGASERLAAARTLFTLAPFWQMTCVDCEADNCLVGEVEGQVNHEDRRF
jgi:hypothetical protein